MKNVFLLIASILICNTTVKAQTNKGSISMGGDFSLDITNHMSWDINTAFGYFIKDNISTGVIVGASKYFISSVKSNDNTKSEDVNEIGNAAGVFTKFYKPIKDNFSLFANLQGIYSLQTTQFKIKHPLKGSTIINSNKEVLRDINLIILPGFAFFPSSKWEIEFNVNKIIDFNFHKKTISNANVTTRPKHSKSKNLKTNFGLSPTLSVLYFLK